MKNNFYISKGRLKTRHTNGIFYAIPLGKKDIAMMAETRHRGDGRKSSLKMPVDGGFRQEEARDN